jgi:hypothetical protein
MSHQHVSPLHQTPYFRRSPGNWTIFSGYEGGSGAVFVLLTHLDHGDVALDATTLESRLVHVDPAGSDVGAFALGSVGVVLAGFLPVPDVGSAAG